MEENSGPRKQRYHSFGKPELENRNAMMAVEYLGGKCTREIGEEHGVARSLVHHTIARVFSGQYPRQWEKAERSLPRMRHELKHLTRYITEEK